MKFLSSLFRRTVSAQQAKAGAEVLGQYLRGVSPEAAASFTDAFALRVVGCPLGEVQVNWRQFDRYQHLPWALQPVLPSQPQPHEIDLAEIVQAAGMDPNEVLPPDFASLRFGSTGGIQFTAGPEFAAELAEPSVAVP